MRYFPPRFLLREYEIRKKIKSLKNRGSFLEIGPGKMEMTRIMLQYFSEGTVVDFNSKVSQYRNELPPSLRERVQVIIGDFLEMEDSTKFDCIIFCEVLEHVVEDEAFLKKCFSLLEDNGCIILSVPARQSLWYEHDEMVGHVRRYEKEQLEDLLTSVGLKRPEVISYGFPLTRLLRLPRLLWSKGSLRDVKDDQIERTTRSGIEQTSNMPGWVGFFINRYTFLPINIFSSLFNKMDLSDGYVAIAYKEKDL